MELGFKQVSSHDAKDPVIFRCEHCGGVSWADKPSLPRPDYANTCTGTWVRCGHCDKPVVVPDSASCELEKLNG